MKLNPKLTAFCAFCLSAAAALAQGNAFTYQGRLNDGSSPANGSYDLTFALFGTGSGGAVLTIPQTNAATAVSNGLFTVTLDFGAGIFTGPARWLEIGARTNGAAAFVTLTPRQQLTPSPYAIFAGTAAIANSAAPGSVTVSSLAAIRVHVHWRKAAAFAEGRLGDHRRADNVLLATAGSASTVPGRRSVLRSKQTPSTFSKTFSSGVVNG